MAEVEQAAVPGENRAENGTEEQKGSLGARLGSRNGRAVLLVVLVLAIVASVVAWRYYAVREGTDNAQIEGDIVPVSAKVGGTVLEVKVSDNKYVEAGTVLAQIDPRDYQIAVQKAEADAADAEATARGARATVPIISTSSTSGVVTAQSNVAAVRQEVAMALARQKESEANYTRAATDLKRMQQLVEKDEISRQQFDASVAAEQSAKAALDAARAAVATAESRVAQARSQLTGASTAPEQITVSRAKAESSEALVQQRRATLEQAKLNLQYTTIKTTIGGIVRKSVQPGQTVAPGQPMFAIVSVENVWVVANFKETQLKKMRVGQGATIHVDAYGRNYRGHVESIGGATAAKFSLLPPENATGNFVKVVQRIPVKIVFEKDEDPEHQLRPGMSVVPTVHTR